MTTIEEKQMLAEFMGWDKEYKSVYYKSVEAITLIFKMRFEDYNSLMEVVERIEKLNVAIEIGKDFCTIWHHGINSYYKRITKESKLSAIYSACVQFVSWWSEQKKEEGK